MLATSTECIEYEAGIDFIRGDRGPGNIDHTRTMTITCVLDDVARLRLNEYLNLVGKPSSLDYFRYAVVYVAMQLAVGTSHTQ